MGYFAGSYNGSTAAFEAVNLGSIPSPAASMKDTCPICLKQYTRKNYPEIHHLKYKNPEETMVGCRYCNHAEYYFRHPEEVSVMSHFWRWWWRKRIELVMAYYKEKRVVLKTLAQYKILKFTEDLVPLILSGKKTSTWRLFDDKNLQVRDELIFINKQTGEEFAKAVITEVKSKEIQNIEPSDHEGHGEPKRNEEILEEFKKIYGSEVTLTSVLKILKFSLL